MLFPELHRFEIPHEFLSEYPEMEVPWGYGDLSRLTYRRTYSRLKPDGSRERWWETCRRVVEGTFTVLKTHCLNHHLPWDEEEAWEKACDMMDRMFCFKWLPPGRGIWMMGTEYVYERSGAPLNNCAFRSTKNINLDFAEPFVWTFTMLMLGVGVGFDVRGAKLGMELDYPHGIGKPFVVEDSREGWAAALERALRAWSEPGVSWPSEWDVSNVRGKGEPIKSFGGVASGPQPLLDMLEQVHDLLSLQCNSGEPVDAALIVDIMNVIGACVVSGGVRRTAEISFGEPDDDQFLHLKQDPEKLKSHRWASNNSVLAEVGMDYSKCAELTVSNGEPGYMWLENARAFGRMADVANWDDHRAEGGNPCLEQTLEDKELCTLVENFPARHDDFEDLRKTLKVSYMYAKAVTLVPTHDLGTNAVMQRNRRIGCSMSGIVQAVQKFGMGDFIKWCDEGYKFVRELDEDYSDWLCVPRSIKVTSVKPSGTVSILAGATPGVHWDHSPFYIRRIRLQEGSPLVQACRDAGYPVEEDVYSRDTMVVEFPVQARHMERGKTEVSAWEKASLAVQMQRWWADNQVSCTVDFDPETESDDVRRILEHFDRDLKGISFLPSANSGYEQLPYEEITEAEYLERLGSTEPLVLDEDTGHEVTEKFCDGDTCLVE